MNIKFIEHKDLIEELQREFDDKIIFPANGPRFESNIFMPEDNFTDTSLEVLGHRLCEKTGCSKIQAMSHTFDALSDRIHSINDNVIYLYEMGINKCINSSDGESDTVSWSGFIRYQHEFIEDEHLFHFVKSMEQEYPFYRDDNNSSMEDSFIWKLPLEVYYNKFKEKF